MCGFSDITALDHALLAHAGLLTYSGPHWSTLAMRDRFEHTLDHVGTDVLGLVIGRFQRDSRMTRNLLQAVVDTPMLRDVPVVANVDYGHTSPMLTLPVGGEIEVDVAGDDIGLRLLKY